VAERFQVEALEAEVISLSLILFVRVLSFYYASFLFFIPWPRDGLYGIVRMS